MSNPQRSLFDEAREDQTVEMLKDVLQRLNKIETLILRILENQAALFEEPSSDPGEEGPELELVRDDEF